MPRSRLSTLTDTHWMESTQPADDGGKACARFVRVAGPGRVAMETESQFEVSWQHGERVELGRAGSTGSGGSARVVLCASSAQGISRQHGWLRFDRERGLEFTVCASAGAAVTFINGQFVAANARTVVLKHDDMLGFGGASVTGPGPGTVVYQAHFVGMPELVRMPPPPPPPPAKRVRDDETGAGASAEAEEPRGRGEKSKSARKRRKVEAEAASAAVPPAAKVAGGLEAQAALAKEHATLVEPLCSGQRKWARRGLECASQCYGIMQEAVRMAAEEDGDGVLHTAIVRMQHKIQALAGESARAQQGQRSGARTEQQQHGRHDHAAQRRNQDGGGRGRGNGGGKGGGGKGGGKGGYGKGGGGGKGGSGGSSGRRRR